MHLYFTILLLQGSQKAKSVVHFHYMFTCDWYSFWMEDIDDKYFLMRAKTFKLEMIKNYSLEKTFQ